MVLVQKHTYRSTEHNREPRNKSTLWKGQSLSCVQLFATPWTVAHQASLSMEFSRQEYWSGMQIFPTQGSNQGLPNCRQILHYLSHQGSPKNTGVGNHSLLLRIFPNQGSNPGTPHCRQILYKSMYLWSIHLWQRRQKYTREKKKVVSSESVRGQLDSHM